MCISTLIHNRAYIWISRRLTHWSTKWDKPDVSHLVYYVILLIIILLDCVYWMFSMITDPNQRKSCHSLAKSSLKESPFIFCTTIKIYSNNVNKKSRKHVGVRAQMAHVDDAYFKVTWIQTCTQMFNFMDHTVAYLKWSFSCSAPYWQTFTKLWILRMSWCL